MGKMAVSGLVAVMAVASFADTTVTTNGTELTIDVPTGGSYTHVEAVPSSFTKITKTGAGSCAFAPETITFTGTMDIQAGTMHGDRVKFGAPAAWKVTPGAALRFDEVSSGYTGGETGKPAGTLEIGGMGCDDYPAYYFTMLPYGTTAGKYTTSHGNFSKGVTLTADTSVGGGRWGFATMDMQGHDLYLSCTNGDARYEMYYDIANAGNFRVKKGAVLIERAMKFTTALTGQAYILANGANIYMWNVDPTESSYQAAKLNIGLEDNASGKITMTGSGTLSANRNTWYGDWVLGKGKQLWLYCDALGHPGTMKGNIDAPLTEIYKSGDGPYTITADGTHKFKILNVAIGALFLGANKDGSAYQITNRWNMSGSAQDNNVTRLTLGPGLKTVSAGTQKIANEGIVVASSGSDGQRNAIVDISDGCVISNNFLLGTENSGGTKAAVGAIYMGDATVYWKAGGSNDGFIGQNTKGYGYLLQKAGTFSHRGYLNLGATGRGRVDQRGGTHRIETGDPLKIARTGSNSWGCYYQTGGTFDGKLAWFNYNNVTNCEVVESVLTTTGEDSLFKCDNMKAFMSCKNVDTIVNVNDGATLQGRLYREIAFSGYNAGSWTTLASQMTNTTHLYVNVNGGILKSLNYTDIWGNDRLRGPTRVTVYEKGVTFDSTGQNIQLFTELVKPFGKGIKSVSLAGAPAWLTGTNHYVAPPRVKITSQTGTGASIVAVFDETKRQNVRFDVVSPGCGYEDATISVEDVSLGSYTLTDAAVLTDDDLSTTGGVRKVGTGSLTLHCANTYGGVTRVENGQIVFTHPDGLPENSALEFAASAVAGGDKTAPLLSAVNYNGGEIRITEADTLDFGTFGRSRVLATFTNALTAMPTVKLVNSDGTELTSADWKASLSEDGKTLRFGRNIGLMLLLR